jgi:hypothetical protein
MAPCGVSAKRARGQKIAGSRGRASIGLGSLGTGLEFLRGSGPNYGMQATAYSLRSALASHRA